MAGVDAPWVVAFMKDHLISRSDAGKFLKNQSAHLAGLPIKTDMGVGTASTGNAEPTPRLAVHLVGDGHQLIARRLVKNSHK